MATLVQTVQAVQSTPSPSRSQGYPLVRPSSSSATMSHSQRMQPLYLLPQPQMYIPQQAPPAPFLNYDYSRPVYANQPKPQQRRQNTAPSNSSSHQNSMSRHHRSRSDEPLHDKSIMQSSLPPVTTQVEAQSAPRPQSMISLRPSTSAGPSVASFPRETTGPRPSSADGKRHDGRQIRTASSIIDSRVDPRGFQRDLSQAYTQSRYSEDIPTIKPVYPSPQPHPVQPQFYTPLQGQQYYPPRPHTSHAVSHASHSLAMQSNNRHPPVPPQRQISLPPPPIRLGSPPPPSQTLKRVSSVPDLPAPGSLAHRKSSSNSSNTSAASAPSQLETTSSQSSQPNETHTPITPSPLGRASEESESLPDITVVPPTPVESKSFSARLKRALSFSGGNTLTTSRSTSDLHAEMQREEVNEDEDDRMSISSTASSASIMLRKMSQGLKRSRKSIIGIFKGATRRRKRGVPDVEDVGEEEEEDKFPFGVPGEENVGVSYISAEGEIAEMGDRRKSMVFSDRETSVKESVQLILSGKKKGKKHLDTTPVKGILKNYDSRQSSFEGNGSTESIPSIKASLISDSSTKDAVSDFAKSLASTLDSQLSHLNTAKGDMSPPSTPKEQLTQPYFDITPPDRQVVTAPATPTGSNSAPRRGIQFSPRLEVHETWHSAEYDRRGEPATCNRLTAQLAQMIKDELNAFKMEEMIVHEDSRAYTHFF